MRIVHHLKFFASALWSGYRSLPPAVKIAGGLVAIVVLTKWAWPIGFLAIITATITLLRNNPAAD